MERWGGIHWTEVAEVWVWSEPTAVRGVLPIEPSVRALCLLEGIWDRVNEACQTTLGDYEETELSATQATVAASEIRAHCASYDGENGVIRRIEAIGIAPAGIHSVELPATELRASLLEIAAFLERAGEDGRSVCVHL